MNAPARRSFHARPLRLARAVALGAVMLALGAAPVRSQTGAKDRPPMEQPVRRPTGNSAPQFHARSSGEVEMGERAPDFELDGSDGKPVKLSSFRGRWTLLAFGDRKEEVAPLRQVHAELDSAGIGLVAVCAEKSYFLESFARREKFPFLLLADVTREVSDMYGLYDSRERTVRPGYFLLAADGEVKFALLGQVLAPGDVARFARYVAGLQ